MRVIQKFFFMLALIITGMGALGAEESIQLDGITIHGNRELPKSLVIVPWKASEPGKLGNQSTKRFMNDILAPVDRDEFRREMKYYQAMHAADENS